MPDTPFQEGFDYDDYDPYDVPEDQKAEILPGERTFFCLNSLVLSQSKSKSKSKVKSQKSKGLGVTLFCCATHHPPTTQTFISNQTLKKNQKFYSGLRHSRV